MMAASNSISSYQNPAYRFCLQTSTDLLELSAESLDLRNEWLGQLVWVVERKSELGHFVSTVRSEADYRHVRGWEAAVVSQSIPACSGLVLPIAPAASAIPTAAQTCPTSPSTGNSSITTITASIQSSPQVQAFNNFSSSPSYAGFLPFDKWEERFEPEAVRLRMEKEKGQCAIS